MIVYGSTALRIGLEKIGRCLDRTPTDLDVFASADEAREFIRAAGLVVVPTTTDKRIIAKGPDGKMVEIEIIFPGTSTLLYYQWAETMSQLDTAELYGVKMEIAPLEMLYSLKRSHRHSPRAFHKHIRDYNLLRKLFGGKDVFSKVTAMRYKEVVERERLRTPSLNRTTVDFFDDKVSNRTFIHDQIHEVMAHAERPMFERIKIDPDKVACSKEKFFLLSDTERRMCVQEEAYVIALERAMIPMLFEGEKIAVPHEAYAWAVMRICTTLCSGWFREYAVENYENIMLWYDQQYVHKFLRAVEDGRIRRIEQ
jgi:hypothetical protein